MNLGLVSLIVLLLAIIIGFARNANVGILCVGFSMILSIVYKVDIKTVIAGLSSSLFIQMVGITYLFAIIQRNGTLELLARKMVRLVGTIMRCDSDSGKKLIKSMVLRTADRQGMC